MGHRLWGVGGGCWYVHVHVQSGDERELGGGVGGGVCVSYK